MKLVIANKTYSSWSLRAWLALKATGAPFEEVLVRLDEPTTAEEIARHSPAGRVPVLVDGDVVVWDSLAIVEHLAERFPKAGLWPEGPHARALARSIVAEMHAGFSALRGHYPMNFRRNGKGRPADADADRDVERIKAIWRDARERFGATGPFLFGAFGAADAFYAPVASRLRSYGVPLAGTEEAYVEAVLSHPFLEEWAAAAAEEPWVVAHDEVD